MNLVTIQNIFASWSLALDKDSIYGFGSLVYLKTSKFFFSFEFFFPLA